MLRRASWSDSTARREFWFTFSSVLLVDSKFASRFSGPSEFAIALAICGIETGALPTLVAKGYLERTKSWSASLRKTTMHPAIACLIHLARSRSVANNSFWHTLLRGWLLGLPLGCLAFVAADPPKAILLAMMACAANSLTLQICFVFRTHRAVLRASTALSSRHQRFARIDAYNNALTARQAA